MLRELRIRNYALIEKLDLDLPGGLVAFTGETGAGKSIIIGALALVLGARAQPEQLRSGAGEILVEARFDGALSPAATGLLEEAGIGRSEELLLNILPSPIAKRLEEGEGMIAAERPPARACGRRSGSPAPC